jgi:hypothetical protein
MRVVAADVKARVRRLFTQERVAATCSSSSDTVGPRLAAAAVCMIGRTRSLDALTTASQAASFLTSRKSDYPPFSIYFRECRFLCWHVGVPATTTNHDLPLVLLPGFRSRNPLDTRALKKWLQTIGRLA